MQRKMILKHGPIFCIVIVITLVVLVAAIATRNKISQENISQAKQWSI